ncbi:GNAT family N-acetyltransferase [Bacillus spongiae]|uniref:GNAT family N-acetyltransferase n=1 Tax=Bacillus spongiae TaxID=2683610 RepID=A0ABU8HDV6_9BACI
MEKIRKGKVSDIDKIMEIVRDTIDVMKENHNDQWTEEYPRKQDFQNDIQNETLYVAVNEEDEPIGMITVDQEEAEEYRPISWREKGDAFVFHRIAVDVNVRGGGIASKLIQHAEKVAMEQGVPYMKTDTYSKNKVAQKLFEKNGYRNIGTIPTLFGKSNPFFAYDKILTDESSL